jgi:hypothetical protein
MRNAQNFVQETWRKERDFKPRHSIKINLSDMGCTHVFSRREEMFKGVHLRNNCTSSFYYYYHYMFRCSAIFKCNKYRNRNFAKLTMDPLLEHWFFFHTVVFVM